jgi:hypothetical protein
MEKQLGYCAICQRTFQATTDMQRREQNQAYCDECTTGMKVLDHHHNLSVDVTSLEDLNAITHRLLRVDNPTTCDCMSHYSCTSRVETYEGLYWLSCSYDSISRDLLYELASLNVHFTLYDTQTYKDSLYFWLGDKAPAGTLAFLLNHAS